MRQIHSTVIGRRPIGQRKEHMVANAKRNTFPPRNKFVAFASPPSQKFKCDADGKDYFEEELIHCGGGGGSAL